MENPETRLKGQQKQGEPLTVIWKGVSTIFDGSVEGMIVKDKVDRPVSSDTKFFVISLVSPIFQVLLPESG